MVLFLWMHEILMYDIFYLTEIWKSILRMEGLKCIGY